MKLHLLILFLALCMGSHAFPVNGDWVLESEKDGIQIFTKEVEGAKYKQVKGVTEIPVAFEHVVRVLTDFNRYDVWMDHITESNVVNSTDDSTYYVFTLEDSPWPVQNRYNVSKMTVTEESRQCTIAFESIPNYMEKRVDAIEMKRQRGFWKLSQNPEGGCVVEFYLDRNPGGYVPAWLVNYMMIETPFKTLQNLKSVMDRIPRP